MEENIMEDIVKAQKEMGRISQSIEKLTSKVGELNRVVRENEIRIACMEPINVTLEPQNDFLKFLVQSGIFPGEEFGAMVEKIRGNSEKLEKEFAASKSEIKAQREMVLARERELDGMKEKLSDMKADLDECLREGWVEGDSRHLVLMGGKG